VRYVVAKACVERTFTNNQSVPFGIQTDSAIMAPKGNAARRSKPAVPARRARVRDSQITMVCPSVTNSTSFACSQPASLKERNQALYSAGMSGGASTGGVTTHTELGLSVTDFFDYQVLDPGGSGVSQPVTNHMWSVDQNLFENGTSAAPFTDNERTFCRPRKLEVYVLPVKGFAIGASSNSSPNENNAEGMYTVQAQVPGVAILSDSSGIVRALAADTQVTNVLPQVDTFWKKVLTCDLQKTFKSGVMRPYFDTTGVAVSSMCLFQMSIVDSTSGATYFPSGTETAPLSIRVKVVIHVDQPIATIQNAKLAVFRNESFLFPTTAQNGAAYGGTPESYVQIDLKKVNNYSR
jgi:hypothetical protein